MRCGPLLASNHRTAAAWRHQASKPAPQKPRLELSCNTLKAHYTLNMPAATAAAASPLAEELEERLLLLPGLLPPAMTALPTRSSFAAAAVLLSVLPAASGKLDWLFLRGSTISSLLLGGGFTSAAAAYICCAACMWCCSCGLCSTPDTAGPGEPCCGGLMPAWPPCCTGMPMCWPGSTPGPPAK